MMSPLRKAAALVCFSLPFGPFTGCGEKAPPADSAGSGSGSGGDSGGDSGEADPATVALSGACPQEADRGGFLVSVSDDASSVGGSVADGVVPTSVLEPIASAGDCTLLRRDNPFCDPACDPGETCDRSGACVPYPSNQDLGAVSLAGLSEDLTMEPVFPGNTYFDTTLAHPAFTGGELITLSMPGGVYGPATLHGVGVEALDATGLAWVLQEGLDTVITWPAPSAPAARSEVAVTISIDQHGVTPSTLRCVFEDDGEGTVPASVVDAMLAAGVTGFPAGALERRTADSAAAGEGCMDLIVAFPRVIPVDVIGYTPCLSDAECPDGQTCNEALQICES